MELGVCTIYEDSLAARREKQRTDEVREQGPHSGNRLPAQIEDLQVIFRLSYCLPLVETAKFGVSDAVCVYVFLRKLK